jgi:hypothetical protein
MNHSRRPKEIEEEQESVSQQIRNWNGGVIVYDNIKQRLGQLRGWYEGQETGTSQNQSTGQAEIKKK